jgi:2-dehydropantoate 2-reductase
VSKPIVIWGAGAIGGVIGAHLQRAGLDLLFVDKAADHLVAMASDGLKISGPLADFTLPVRASAPEALEGRYDTIFLAVKALDTEAACHQIAPHLSAEGCVVSLQNGLNERCIARVLGAERCLGAFINFGADYLGPGEIHYGGRGAVVLGELDGRKTPRAEALQKQLSLFDDRAVLTDNIWGYLWAKQSYGALLYATALTDASIAEVLASPRHRRLLIALAREVLAVAKAEAVEAEPFDGYEPGAFLDGDDATAARSLDDLVAFNQRSAKTHSGIWRDLAVRKRKTEVDHQVGAVVEVAAAHGVATPICARLQALIHAIEDGERPLAWETLDELAAVLTKTEAASP